ncbi:MAG TPA: hypothetical protein VF134_08860 [Candidatus Dormibacteraeota bacterium]
MSALLGRFTPAQVPPRLALALAAATLLILIAVAAGVLLEGLLSRGAALALRLTHHSPPRKSPARIRLDELDARLRARERESQK